MKTIIVYYSLEGNTEYAARQIAAALGADTLRLEVTKAYPTSGFKKFFWGGKSAVMAETPKLEPYRFDGSQYDRVIFGFFCIVCLLACRNPDKHTHNQHPVFDYSKNIKNILFHLVPFCYQIFINFSNSSKDIS